MSRSNSFQRSKVRRIAGWMRAGGIAQVEVARENLLVRIRLDASAAPSAGGTTKREEPACREPPPSTVVVASDAVGILCDRYPVGNSPLVEAGDPVRTGMTVALIRVGPLYRRLRSPSAGTFARWLVQPGERVDFGKPILELVNTSRTS
jgi:biotin carboxyl carrier protein